MKIKKVYYLTSICFIVSLSLFLFGNNKVEAACYGCLADGLGHCSIDTTDCTIGWCSNTNYCMVNHFTGDPMVYSITTDPCIEGIKQCKSATCGGLVGTDGDPCKVVGGVGDVHWLGGCAANPVNTGTWSSNRCILCSGIKTESGIYGDAAGIYAGGGIAGDMLCEANGCGASPECDEQAPTWIGVGGFCDASCTWVPTIGLSLTTAASPDTIALGGSSTITFKVTKSGIDVLGATVSGISVTSGIGNVSANSCITNASGECTVTYNNVPATSTVATIKATKAAKAPETDSGSASDTVTVNDCLGSTLIGFISDPYAIGDTIRFRGRDNANSFAICIYNPAGNRRADNELNPASGLSEEVTYVADAIGTWTGTIELGGVPTCPATLAAASSCFDTAIVGGAACTPNGGGCGGDGDCCSGNCDSGTCAVICTPATTCGATPWSVCGSINPAEQERSCSDGCEGTINETQICCSTDDDCADPTPVCNPATEQCVQCITSDDCAGTNVCNNYFCIPCTEDGEVPPDDDEDLCCLGLGYWDMDGDGTDECTSACDPDAWFFCNPLRGSVETIVQAGETLLGYILGLIGSIALLFIIIAGMMYMTSAGNEERISSSKKILSGAVIGLMIALLAYGLLHVIMTVLGM